jgi:signal transduction histidine kinase
MTDIHQPKHATSSAASSIRIQIVVLPLFLLALLAGLVAYNSNRVIKNAMIENARALADQTSQMLNITVAPYAATGNLGEIGVFLGELLLEKRSIGLSYVLVAREEDDIALLQIGAVGSIIPPASDLASIDKAVYQGVVHIRRPILLTNNKVGYLQYGLVSELLLAASNRVEREGIMLIAFGSLISAVLLFLLGWRLARRINTLVDASDAVARGDYSLQVNAQGKDEIASLARNFNLMAGSIRSRMDEITNLNVTLEERVIERTNELSASNHQLQETICHLENTRDSLVRSEKLASLGALVAGVAHELNTPLGNALTVASALQARVVDLGKEYSSGQLRKATLDEHLDSTQEACSMITRNLARADQLVSSFKHVAVDQTSEHKREFDLRAVVDEIVATLLPSIKKQPYTIQVAIPPGIHMDSYPGPLGQVITNLVNNAVVHAFAERPAGTIQLLACADEARGVVTLKCVDDGRGIPDSILPRIFDPFFTTRLGKGGSGLGLNIVHNIVESVLLGTISADSRSEGGACFTLVLPLRVEEDRA